MQFLFGGLSGMLATCVVQPLDLVKTRYRYSFSLGISRSPRYRLILAQCHWR
jgi:hypothetical protein